MIAATKTLAMDIDPEKIESGAKVIVTLAAAYAVIWKICHPACKWFRNWLKTGERISSLVETINRELKPNGTPVCDKIAEIRSHVMLLSAREQLRFENSPIPSYECDKNGNCVAVNPAWCKLFGVTDTHMLGNGWLDVISDPEERERVLENWQSSVKNRYPHRERYQAKNSQTGDVIWCESTTIEVMDKNQVTLLYCGTIKVCAPNWTPPA
jgi:PAS domain S-box-containing protein